MKRVPCLLMPLLAAVALFGFAGCRKNQVDQALDSDANGYMCLQCKAKFYTDRDVFPTRCPDCRQPGFQMVLGFVCASEQHITLAPRGRDSAACEKCGKITSSLSIPKEADFKAWGATKRTAAEVGG